MGEKRLLTVQEVSTRLEIGRDAAYQLARRYGIRLGKSWRIPSRVVDALLDGRLDELEEPPRQGRGL